MRRNRNPNPNFTYHQMAMLFNEYYTFREILFDKENEIRNWCIKEFGFPATWKCGDDEVYRPMREPYRWTTNIEFRESLKEEAVTFYFHDDLDYAYFCLRWS